MNKAKNGLDLLLALALAVTLLVSTSCAGTTTEKLRDAAERATAVPATAEPSLLPTGETQPASETPTQQRTMPPSTTAPQPTTPPEPTTPPTPTSTLEPIVPPTPTSTLEPTATPMPKAKETEIVAYGFGQDDRDLGFAFLVANPNAGFAVESSQYQVAAYDEAGAVVETESGYIEIILPGQTLGVAGTMWLDEDVRTSEIEVQLLEGEFVPTEPIPTFTVDNAIYQEGDYAAYATGIVGSLYNRDLENVRVSAVVYNQVGDIIGGGFAYLDFILAGSTTGVEVSVTSSEGVAEVGLFPCVSGLTFLGSEEGMPEGAANLELLKQGFGQGDSEIGFGMLIENPNDALAVEDSQYHVTAYSEDGAVIGVDEGYINVILPGQSLGVGGDLFVRRGIQAARVDIQIKAGDFVDSERIPAFSAENISYQAGAYSPSVTGQIISPYAKDITDLRVSAIAYNDAQEIIGGGFTYLDFVPALGKAAVEVFLTSAGIPALTELYAMVSGLSDYR